LDYESLKRLNPRLIYCSITGFGQTGPLRHKPGYDSIFQALGGLMSVTGLPDEVPGGGPMKVGPSIVDLITGQFAAIAIISALYDRDLRGGEGQYLDLALYDSIVATMSHHAMHYLLSGAVPPRRGTEGQGGTGGKVYRCADGDVLLTIGNDAQWDRFCGAIGRPDLCADERFSNNRLRTENRQALYPLIENILKTWSVPDLLAKLETVGVPAAPINDLAAVFADPQIRSREMEMRIPHPLSGGFRMVASPMRFSRTPITAYSPPPLLGANTVEVLRDLLGLSEESLQQLQQEAVIG
jgi:crotonobetainyl-CoA:carnitine CoA-transferase CaiB-like acyl-CoA transferase